MCTTLTGKVYSVGDGFCYEGIIQDEKHDEYHFVIDCGNKTPTCRKRWSGKMSKRDCENRLDKITDEITSNSKRLHLFILTHLHADHYSGYRYLFWKTSIDTIIMPYLYPEERLYLMLDNQVEEEEARFLANPYSAVLDQAREKNPDVKLVLIRGNRNPEEDRYLNDRASGDDSWGTPYEDADNIMELEDINSPNVQIVRAFSTGSKLRDFIWMFKFFNIEIDKYDLDIFRKIFGNLTASDLYRKVTDPAEKAGMNRQYQYIANKKLNSDINNTSIVTYHAPVQSHGRCGTLITGDIDLNRGVADDILTYFACEMGRVGLFSIPHHGSQDNWDDRFLGKGMLDGSIGFACTHNYYRNRLTYDMMSSLRVHDIAVLAVDENRSSEILQIVQEDSGQSTIKICSHRRQVWIRLA